MGTIACCKNNLDFDKADEVYFLVFGGPNAKHLALGTLDANALTCYEIPLCYDIVLYRIFRVNCKLYL